MKGASKTLVLSLLLYGFMYLPLAAIVAGSFNDSRLGVEWRGFTTRWYAEAARDEQIRSAVANTLLVAAGSTAISTVLGTMLAHGLARRRFRGRDTLASAFLLPVAVPDIVMAVGLLLFYSLVRQWTGWFQLGLLTMMIGHVTFQIPFVSLAVGARLKGLDRSLEEAASDLGASRWQRFWHVTLPLLRPGILAGALLAFTLSLDDFVVSFFTSGPGSTTLPIYIYSAVKRGVAAEVHALSTLLLAAAVLGSIGVTIAQRRNKKMA